MANLVFALTVLGIYFIVFRYPGVACGLVFASYAIEQYAQTTVPIAASISALCNYLTAGAVLVALVAQVMRHGRIVFWIHAPGVLVLTLLAYCYATLFWSLFPSTTERWLRMNMPYLVVFVGLAPMIIQSVKDVEYAVLGLIVGSTVALLPLILFGQWEGRSVILLNGSRSNPLVLTQAAGSLLIAASLTHVVRKFFPKTWLIVAGVIAFTVLLAFLRSGSRGQIIAAVSVTLLVSSTRKGGWWIPMLGMGIVGMLAVGFLEAEVQQNAFRWDFERLDSDVSNARAGQAIALLKIWSNSAPMRIWLGLGSGVSQDQRILGNYPHVVPAEVLAEEGLIGFGIYCAAILIGVVTYFKAHSAVKGEFRHVVLAIGALCGYEFLLTLKQGNLFSAATFLLLLVLSGPLMRSSSRIPELKKTKPSFLGSNRRHWPAARHAD